MAVTDTTEATEAMIDFVTGEIIISVGPCRTVACPGQGAGREHGRAGRAVEPAHEERSRDRARSELTEHLGHEHKHKQAAIAEKMRDGTRSKTVLIEIGPVEIEVPLNRDGSFEPVSVPKRKRRPDGIDQIVLPLRPRTDHRGNHGALRGGQRDEGLQGNHLKDGTSKSYRRDG